MEIGLFLLTLTFKGLLVVLAMIATPLVLALSVPYILLWPKLDGRTWPGAIRARSWRVLVWVQFMWEAVWNFPVAPIS